MISGVLLALSSTAFAASKWTLSSTSLNQSSWQAQPYVANGYIGQRIPVEGFGYRELPAINITAMDGTSGWPLFDARFTSAMVAGFYDQQGNTTGTNFVRSLTSPERTHLIHFLCRRKQEESNLSPPCPLGLLYT